MENQFQKYVNDLLSLLTTFASFSDERKFSYVYKSFDIPKEQQEIFLSTLISEEVIERGEKIHPRGLLASQFEIMQKMNGELGDGWKFKINKSKLSAFLSENKHISITDKQEIFFKPKLSANGKILIINGEEIQIISSNSTSKELSAPATLAKSLFTTEELYVSKQDFAKELTGDTELNADINKRIRNAVYYLNKKIYTETKLDKYVRIIDGEISISPQYIAP